MKQDGTLYTCDRCEKAMFLPEKQGGYSMRDLKERGWIMHNSMHLCDNCSVTYERVLENFFSNSPVDTEEFDRLVDKAVEICTDEDIKNTAMDMKKNFREWAARKKGGVSDGKGDDSGAKMGGSFC